MKFKPAFTLIEIIIVISILTLFLAMAIPRFHGTYENLRLRSSVNKLYNLLVFIQEKAVFEAVPYQAVYHKPTESIYFEKQNERISTRLIQSIHFDKKISLEWKGAPTLQVKPDGSTNKVEINFRQEGELKYQIKAGEPLGRISLEKI